MNICRSNILTKLLTFVIAGYTILCTRRLQPQRDDCTVRVQWFSSMINDLFIFIYVQRKPFSVE